MKRFWIFCLSLLLAAPAAAQPYLFSYFTGEKDGLRLAYSDDGLKWTPLYGGQVLLKPEIGQDKLMRDPSICQGPDGTFHLVWTSSWTDRIIGYASSKDLVHWSRQQAIPVMAHETDAKNAWAPEVFYDQPSKLFYIVWASTIPGRHSEVPESDSEQGWNHRLYFTTTRDFKTFSPTKIFFNPDFSVIDAAFVRWKGQNVMVLKNENPAPPEKNIRTVTSKNMTFSPAQVSARITDDYWAEGPAPLVVGEWLYVYFDKYRDHRYGAVRTKDLKTWEDVSGRVSLPVGMRHGTAFTAKGLEPLPGQKEWFDAKDLTITGAYYYPEHWKEEQWERDLKKMAELGFEFIHFAEFAWAQLEPVEGQYDFGWLDRAVALADKYGLKVVMCTSTATPPVWLTRKHPEILIKNENGTILDHGARQHASFASPVYREYARRMIEKLAGHYGNDKRIIGWQLDNEPAVQFDYNDAAQQRFREFLNEKYGTIQKLNEAWGTSFWSEVYSSFDQINIPLTSMMFMNHHQILDYRRFAALQTTGFLDEQCLLIKKYSKDQWVVTNYIPNYEEGHIGMSPTLDFQVYTRYMVFGEDTGVGANGFRIGDPTRIAWANDFFRPFQGTYGVMELQPGQVNWGRINPQPYPGAVRLWLWSVFAGGSDFTCAYRFRQPLFGTEQYHYGIVGTDGVTVTPGGWEYKQFMDEIKTLRRHYSPKAQKPAAYTARRTAILFNFENSWSIERQKQNATWNTFEHIGRYYNALKGFGAPVDFIYEDKAFGDYPVMIAPAYQLIDPQLVQRWTDYVKNGGHLVLTCRTGHKDRHGRLFEAPFAAPIYDLIGAKMDFYDLLLPNHPAEVEMDGKAHQWNTWAEAFTPNQGTEVWATHCVDFYQGKPAVIHRSLGKGTVTYVGVDTRDGALEKEVLKKLYGRLNISLLDLPGGVMADYRNGMGIAMNYSDKPYVFPLPDGAEILVGTREIGQAGVLVWKEK